MLDLLLRDGHSTSPTPMGRIGPMRQICRLNFQLSGWRYPTPGSMSQPQRTGWLNSPNDVGTGDESHASIYAKFYTVDQCWSLLSIIVQPRNEFWKTQNVMKQFASCTPSG